MTNSHPLEGDKVFVPGAGDLKPGMKVVVSLLDAAGNASKPIMFGVVRQTGLFRFIEKEPA